MASQAASMEAWQSKPSMPDQSEVKKLLMTISPSDTRFIRHLHFSNPSDVFLVEYKGQECILKVVRIRSTFAIFLTLIRAYQIFLVSPRGRSGHGGQRQSRSRSLSKRSRAYVNLKKAGLCDRGIVPKVHGFIECLDPATFGYKLHSYTEDKNFPNAILFEYLPEAASINYLSYTEERMKIALEGMRQICDLALVQHREIYTKHILIVPGPPERVVWIDFDIASSFKDQSVLTAQIKEWLDFEIELAKDLGQMMVKHSLH
jgi:predicted Ser/Thr protein kinase